MSNRHQESPGSPQITASPPPFATEPIPPYRDLDFRRPNAASDATPPPPIHQRAISERHTGRLTQNVERERRNVSIPPNLETAPWTVRVVQSIEEGSDPYTALERATEDYLRRSNRELRRRVRLEDDLRGLDDLCEEYEGDFVIFTRDRDRYRRERDEERERNRALQAQVQTLTDQLAAVQNPAKQPAVVQRAGPVRGGGRRGARGGAGGAVRGAARGGARGGAGGGARRAGRGDATGGTRVRAGRGGRGAAAAAAAEIRRQPQRKCKVVKR